MPTYTQYKDATDTSRGPSPIIWADFPNYKLPHEGGDVIHHFDDFVNLFTIATNDIYFGAVDAGGTILPVADESGATGQAASWGTIQFDGDGGAQDGHVFAWPWAAGATTTGPFRANGTSDRCFFECRFMVDSVANQGSSFFVGLSEGSDILANATLVDTTHVLDTDKSFVGFRTLPADGDAMIPVYQEGGNSVSSGTGVTIAADTWYKVGFAVRGEKATWYVDGVEKRTVTITSSIDWPDGDKMAILIATKVGTGASEVETTIDWIRAGWYLRT